MVNPVKNYGRCSLSWEFKCPKVRKYVGLFLCISYACFLYKKGGVFIKTPLLLKKSFDTMTEC